MKILLLSPYFYDGYHKEFSRNKTGFGLLIPEIAMSIGTTNDTYLLTYMPTKGFEMKSDIGSCKVVKHSVFEILFHSGRKGIKKAFFELINSHFSFKTRIHNCFYWLNYGSVKKQIMDINPDIVHIQDISLPLIEACKDLCIPYLVTLHGINALRDDVDPVIAKLERDYIVRAYLEKTPLTVISTGIKKRIQNDYLNGEKSNNIYVVPNGTNIVRASAPSKENKTNFVVAIGSLCYRKNQAQIIEAIKELGPKFDGYQLHLCGMDMLNGELQEKVKEYNLEDKIIFHGFLSPDQIDKILDKSILNILASKDEGFGISIIEAFSHGVPTVTFSDLDAAEDLYSEDTMLLCQGRTTHDFADVIYKALKKEWNINLIRSHAVDFSLTVMANKYMQVYRNILNKEI